MNSSSKIIRIIEVSLSFEESINAKGPCFISPDANASA